MNSSNKKIILPLIANQIDPILKNLPRWINWRASGVKPKGRYDKVPIDKNGYPTNAQNKENWLSFNEAYERAAKSNEVGVGIVLIDQTLQNIEGHTERYLVGGDLDKCVETSFDGLTRTFSNKAQKVIDLLNTYYEISPSGTGIRFFFTCNELIPSRNHNGSEIYSSGRFLTITGHSHGSIQAIDSERVDLLLKLLFGNNLLCKSKPFDESTKAPLTVENDGSIFRLKSALSVIPSTIDREKWRNILYSIKAHNFHDGESIAREWSESAGEYDKDNNTNGYQKRAFNDVWKYEPKGIGPGTIYHIAREFGWNQNLYQSNLSYGDYDQTSKSDAFGDVFNGREFRKLHHGKLKYCYPRSQWIKFNGMVWEWCTRGEELEAAKSVAINLAKNASEIFAREPESQKAKKAIQHAQNSHGIKRLEAMLITAASEVGMGIGHMSELDKNPMLLGCKNGVIDLERGILLSPNPEMLITRQASAKFNSEATCPRWESFLKDCFLGDEETISYVQKALGYSLTGLVNEEVLHFCFGTGRNGKSVFANIVTKLMGDYVITAPAEMLMRRDRNSATNDIARLCGARLVLANETRSDQRFDDLTIKTLVSTERISARFLHQEFFEFWPTFKIWVRGNHQPIISDDSEGAWRRMRLIPFLNNLALERVDSDLENKLLLEKEGILAWMVKGTLKWRSEGLIPSMKIKAASNQYRIDCDYVGDFLAEICDRGDGFKVGKNELFRIWQIWSKDSGYKSGSKNAFTRRLKDRGIGDKAYLNGERAYEGLQISNTTSQKLKQISESPF